MIVCTFEKNAAAVLVAKWHGEGNVSFSLNSGVGSSS